MYNYDLFELIEAIHKGLKERGYTEYGEGFDCIEICGLLIIHDRTTDTYYPNPPPQDLN